jgi:glycerol-3-phosphate dehydrogenase
MNDARVNVNLALTAAKYGAAVANHTEVVSIIKKDGKAIGAHMRDVFTGDEFDVIAKVVINSTGPFTGDIVVHLEIYSIIVDSIRKMDQNNTKNMIVPSSGVHVSPITLLVELSHTH